MDKNIVYQDTTLTIDERVIANIKEEDFKCKCGNEKFCQDEKCLDCKCKKNFLYGSHGKKSW